MEKTLCRWKRVGFDVRYRLLCSSEKLMTFTLPLLALLLAAVALVGNTWDSSAKGIKKLTVTGWFTLLLGLATFAVSCISLIKENREEDLLRKLVNAEVGRGLRLILSPFRQLHMETHGGSYKPEESINIEMLLREENLRLAQAMCMDRAPETIVFFPDRGTWRDIFRADIAQGLDVLSNVADSEWMKAPPQLLAEIHDLKNTSGLAASSARSNSTAGASSYVIPECAIGQPIDWHKDFLLKLKRIDDFNRLDGAG